MNELIKKQLNKCRKAQIPAFDNTTTKIIIPKTITPDKINKISRQDIYCIAKTKGALANIPPVYPIKSIIEIAMPKFLSEK